VGPPYISIVPTISSKEFFMVINGC
jgi:hypothetical protein